MSADLKGLYKSCLSSAFIEIGKDDKLLNHLPGSDSYIPVQLEGKPIRLSGPSARQSSDWWLAHPLMEVVSPEPTPVVNRLITAHAQALHLKMQSLFTAILLLAVSPAEQSLCKGDTGDLLRACKNVTERDLELLKQLANEINNPASADHRFVRLKIKPNLKKGKVTYQYGVVASFPLYKKLKTDPKPRKIGRVNVTNKAVDNYISVMEAIFPDINQDDAFLYEPLVETSPRYSAALNAVSDIAGRLNDISEVMEGFSFDHDQIHTDLSWVDELTSFKANHHPQALTWTRERTSAVAMVEPSINPVVSSSVNSTMAAAANNLFSTPASAMANSQVAPRPMAPTLPAPAGPSPSPSKSMTMEEFHQYINRKNGPQASTQAQVMTDSSGRQWVVENGQATALTPGAGQAQANPMQVMMPTGMLQRPAEPAVAMNQQAVGTWTDPSTGLTWYVNAMGQPISPVQQPVMQPGLGYPAQAPVQAQPMQRPATTNWRAVANSVVTPTPAFGGGVPGYPQSPQFNAPTPLGMPLGYARGY